MPYMQVNLGEATEDELVPEGEYDLVISNVEEGESKKSGADQVTCVIDIQNAPEGINSPAPIFHYLTMPKPDDEPRTMRFKLRVIRRFLAVFNVPFEENGFNTDDLQGAAGSCMVVHQEISRGDPPQPTGEFSHTLRLPKFTGEVDEEEEEQSAPRARRGRRQG